jgi:hypothetical protein
MKMTIKRQKKNFIVGREKFFEELFLKNLNEIKDENYDLIEVLCRIGKKYNIDEEYMGYIIKRSELLFNIVKNNAIKNNLLKKQKIQEESSISLDKLPI